MTKEAALIHSLIFAGYEDDRIKWNSVCENSWINNVVDNECWDKGIELRKRGEAV